MKVQAILEMTLHLREVTPEVVMCSIIGRSRKGSKGRLGMDGGEDDKRHCPEGVELASVEISSAGLSGKTRHSIGVGAMSRLCTCAVLFY